MGLSPYERGMLHVSCMKRRIYLGCKGCELVGYQSGRWWTALSLWFKGHLRRDGQWIRHGYGSPGVYLVPTAKGRAAIAPHPDAPAPAGQEE